MLAWSSPTSPYATGDEARVVYAAETVFLSFRLQEVYLGCRLLRQPLHGSAKSRTAPPSCPQGWPSSEGWRPSHIGTLGGSIADPGSGSRPAFTVQATGTFPKHGRLPGCHSPELCYQRGDDVVPSVLSSPAARPFSSLSSSPLPSFFFCTLFC